MKALLVLQCDGNLQNHQLQLREVRAAATTYKALLYRKLKEVAKGSDKVSGNVCAPI